MNKVHFSSQSDNWGTPAKLYEALNEEFHFNDDPCPLDPYAIGGLMRAWGTSVFVNPPYSKIADWVKYAHEQAKQNKTVVMLIPSRTDTRWWHDFCMKADEIRFIRGRLKFGNAKHSAPFPSALVIWRAK